MSGDRETAKLALGRPLDGVVRCHCSPLVRRREVPGAEEGSTPQCARMRACSQVPRGQQATSAEMRQRARDHALAEWHGPACAGRRRASATQSPEFQASPDLLAGRLRHRAFPWWDLTFDMSGDRETAQLALGRPLDGVVRCHCIPLVRRREVPGAEEGRTPQCARMCAWSPVPRGQQATSAEMRQRARDHVLAERHGPACAGRRRASATQSRDF